MDDDFVNFYSWARGASISDLRDWLCDTPVADDNRTDLILDLIEAHRSGVGVGEGFEIRMIVEKTKEACGLRSQARSLFEKAHALITEATYICSHPQEKIIRWGISGCDGYASYSQCTQCGLRECGNPTYILPYPKGHNYCGGDTAPDEAKKTFSREVTNEEQEIAAQKRRGRLRIKPGVV